MDVRLGVLFALALPLVLLIWAALRREKAMLRLLDLYWKVSSLWLVAVLLSPLTNSSTSVTYRYWTTGSYAAASGTAGCAETERRASPGPIST